MYTGDPSSCLLPTLPIPADQPSGPFQAEAAAEEAAAGWLSRGRAGATLSMMMMPSTCYKEW